MLTEGKAHLDIKQERISKKAEVFYNPVMKFNRDVTLLLLDSIPNKQMQCALPLCASGVRGIRMLNELKPNKIKSISFNDNNENVVNNLKRNLELNQLDNLIDKSDKIFDINNQNKKSNKQKSNKLDNNSSKQKLQIFIHNKDANQFLSESQGFDYIDLDPFGSPNIFLDQAIKKLSRKSILAVTATDTSALAGTYINATKRKYWSNPLRNELMHEIGVRILMRRVQLIGAQYDRALTPIYCYSKDHYYRIFFKCKKGKSRVDKIFGEHNYIVYDKDKLSVEVKHLDQLRGGLIAGPLWTGELWDKKLADKIAKNKLNLELNNEEQNLLNLIKNESNLISKKSVGFLDLHKFGKVYKKNLSFEKVFNIFEKNNIKTTKTHFTPYGIRGVSGEELDKFITR